MNKMTLDEFKNYVLSEARKLYKAELLKEERSKIEKNLEFLKETEFPVDGIDLSNPETLKQVRQAMLKKATGWATPEPVQVLSEKKYSDKASDFIGKEISHLEKDKGYEHDRAVAAALNVARDKGYKVPEKKNENTTDPATDPTSVQGNKCESTGPVWQMYYFKLKHDNGVIRVKTASTSEEAARKAVANAEGAPESAVQFIKAVPMNIKESESPKEI